MKTTERFDNAVSKLYTAYHSGELSGMQCHMCAVGNICNNNSSWYEPVAKSRPHTKGTYLDDTKLPLICDVLENETIKKTGYSGNELAKVESIFVSHSYYDETKETQFKGLCAVVEYLCELDNIPNVMDYRKLFESENNEPKYQL